MRKNPHFIEISPKYDTEETIRTYASRKYFTGVFVRLTSEAKWTDKGRTGCFQHLALPLEFVLDYEDWLIYSFKSKKTLLRWYEPKRGWLEDYTDVLGFYHGRPLFVSQVRLLPAT